MIRKKLSVIVCMVLGAMSLVACGSKDSAIIEDVSEFVALADYASVPTTTEPYEVTEEDIDSYIEYDLSAFAMPVEVEGRAVESGDTVNIDYTGTKDGVAFEGGSTGGAGYDLVIGSGSFIPGFEDGLIGAQVGETLVLDLTFPEGYNEELGGQDVEFEVVVNRITVKETPELTDDIVVNLEPSVSTIEEYRAFIRTTLEEQYASSYESALANEVFAYIMENSTYSEVPQDTIDYYVDLQDEMNQVYADMYGMTVEEYVEAAYQQTQEEYKETAITVAGDMAREYYTFKAVGKAEDIVVTTDDIKAYAEENYVAAGLGSANEYLELAGEKQVELILLARDVLPALLQYANTDAE